MPKNNVKNAVQDERIISMASSIKTLNEHSDILTKDLSDIKIVVTEGFATIKPKIDWLTWAVRTILFGIIVSIAITIFSTLLK